MGCKSCGELAMARSTSEMAARCRVTSVSSSCSFERADAGSRGRVRRVFWFRRGCFIFGIAKPSQANPLSIAILSTQTREWIGEVCSGSIASFLVSASHFRSNPSTEIIRPLLLARLAQEAKDREKCKGNIAKWQSAFCLATTTEIAHGADHDPRYESTRCRVTPSLIFDRGPFSQNCRSFEMEMVTGFEPVRSFASVDLPNLRL